VEKEVSASVCNKQQRSVVKTRRARDNFPATQHVSSNGEEIVGQTVRMEKINLIGFPSPPFATTTSLQGNVCCILLE
jgi:hypothetical protein